MATPSRPGAGPVPKERPQGIRLRCCAQLGSGDLTERCESLATTSSSSQAPEATDAPGRPTATESSAASAPTAAVPGSNGAAEAAKRWFRGDVDGLRAVAIVLVVAYHAGIPIFRGGFIGVDIFFVISGYLISRNLLRESETNGRVALGRFWARRVRRLVPALALVVAVTLVAGYFILPVFDLTDFAKQGAAATLYVSNVLFAAQARNYFAADITSSPFLHTWSLGVEEQFYLVWPVLFALVCTVVARRAAGRRRPVLIAVFAVTFLVSMGLNVMLTNQSSTWAFFGLPSRAWEFAVAGLLAAVPLPALLRSVAARTAAAVAGIVLLAAALLVIDDRTPYPGLWALLPVGATVLLIIAGETWGGTVTTGPISALLSIKPMQWLGRVSYSWYLWHWPAIVLVAVALDKDTVKLKSATALATLPVAWLAYRFFETPVRFAPFIARSSRRTFVVGGVVTAAVVLLAVAVWPGAASQGPSATTVVVAELQAPPGSTMEQRVNFGVQLYRDRVNHTCPRDSLKTADGDSYCVGGDLESDNTVMLLGDSHAGGWRRTLEAIARDRHIKLLVREHDGCPAYDVNTPSKTEKGSSKICRDQHDGDLRVIDALAPKAVVIAGWSGYEDQILDANGNTPSRADREQLWHDAAASLLARLHDKGIKVGVILDEPTLPADVSQCLVKKGDAERCAVPLAEAMAKSSGLLAAERSAIDAAGGVATADMADVVCDAKRCVVEMDGTIAYVDTHHFTDAFAAKQLPLVDQLVEKISQ